MSQAGQAPKQSEHGSFLQTDSVAGRKNQIVQLSDSQSGSLTLSAGGYGSITMDLVLWPPDLPTSARTNLLNIVPHTKCVGWVEVDLYVDSFDSNYRMGTGASLSSGQLNITSGNNQLFLPNTNKSLSHVYFFKNNDSSSHVIYATIQWKYIIFGEYSI